MSRLTRPTYETTVSIEVPDFSRDGIDYSLSIDITLHCEGESNAFDAYDGLGGLRVYDRDSFSPNEDTMSVWEVRQCNVRIDRDGGDHPTNFELNMSDAEWLLFLDSHLTKPDGTKQSLNWEVCRD